MKKALSVLIAFLCFAVLFSSCSNKTGEDTTDEPSSAEAKSLPMFTDSLKIDLGKAKLYFTTDNKNSVLHSCIALGINAGDITSNFF